MFGLNMKSFTVAVATLASLPATLAGFSGMSAPSTVVAGTNLNVTFDVWINISNEDHFGIVWGLAGPDIIGYNGTLDLIGSEMAYTPLKYVNLSFGAANRPDPLPV
jgi:Nis1 family